MKYMRRLMLMFTFGSPLLYLSSYLLSVQATVGKVAGNHILVPQYSFGGKIAEHLYTPAHWVDTQIRTKYWQGQ